MTAFSLLYTVHNLTPGNTHRTRTPPPDGIQRTEDAEKKKRKLIPPFHTQYPLSHSSHTNVVVLLFTTYSGGASFDETALNAFSGKNGRSELQTAAQPRPTMGPLLRTRDLCKHSGVDLRPIATEKSTTEDRTETTTRMGRWC